jgi:hypothetical protein
MVNALRLCFPVTIAGQDFVDFVRNRNNTSAWLTTDSTDAAGTKLVIDMTDDREFTEIILVKHNLKAFTIKYWDGASFVDFSTPISETTNTETTNHYSFTKVVSDMIEIVITGTQVADDDKVIHQIIVTDEVLTGQLDGWPVIRRPRFITNKKISNMLSGKVNVVESVGGFSMELAVTNWNIDADLDIIEEVYFGRRGVLVWISGGNQTQFSHLRVGYRKEDIFFMRATNDYSPEWNRGIYNNGMRIRMRLQEAIN